MENKELDQKFSASELSTVKDQLAAVEQAAKIKDDRIRELQNTVTHLKSSVAMITELLAHNPSVAALEAAVKRKCQFANSVPSSSPLITS
jgi:hypothetical protein